MTYALRGPASLDIGGSQMGGGGLYQMRAAAGDTEQLQPGLYRLTGWASRPGERHPIYSGVLRVDPNMAAPGAAANLSHAEKAIAALEALIEGRLTRDVESFQIDGRAVNKIPIKDARELLKQYRAEVRSQRGRRRVAFPVVARADFGWSR